MSYLQTDIDRMLYFSITGMQLKPRDIGISNLSIKNVVKVDDSITGRSKTNHIQLF
jgi:hypothetical protein